MGRTRYKPLSFKALSTCHCWAYRDGTRVCLDLNASAFENPCVHFLFFPFFFPAQLADTPTVGVYYEEGCKSSPSALGCAVGGLIPDAPSSCRLCMVNTEQWLAEHPGKRDYDV